MPEPTEAFDLVHDDVHAGLAESFTPRPGFIATEGFGDGEPITNGRHTAVVWEYHGRHDAPFQGVEPTGADIVIRGVTVIEQSGRRQVFHRYVDWLDVMAQLGLTSSMVPALEQLPRRARTRAHRAS
jgi:hypothetical protein